MSRNVKVLTLAVLTTLYFLQGVIYGFQTQVLPVLLRIGGASPLLVGSIQLVTLPWLLKSFWAPFIKSGATAWLWLAGSLWATSLCLIGAQTDNKLFFFLAMFLLNASSATTDLTLAQLLMSMFEAAEIPGVSSLHIISYKTGALAGGGVILWITAYMDKTNAILPTLSAVHFILGFGVTWTSRRVAHPGNALAPEVPRFVTQLSSLVKTPGTLWVAGCVFTFKLASHSAKTFLVLVLVDSGFTASYIGFVSGTCGQLVSIGVVSGIGLLLSSGRYVHRKCNLLKARLHMQFFHAVLVRCCV